MLFAFFFYLFSNIVVCHELVFIYTYYNLFTYLNIIIIQFLFYFISVWNQKKKDAKKNINKCKRKKKLKVVKS